MDAILLIQISYGLTAMVTSSVLVLPVMPIDAMPYGKAG